MPKFKSNVLSVSINGKDVGSLALRRSGNGHVILGLYSNDKKKKDSRKDSMSIGSLEVDRRDTHYYYHYVEQMPLKTGDIITIKVCKSGTLSKATSVTRETKRLRLARKQAFQKAQQNATTQRP